MHCTCPSPWPSTLYACASRWQGGALAWAALFVASMMTVPGVARAFGFEEVAARAQAEARRPYRAVAPALPAELASLGYDEHRDIRFRPDRALWRREGLPFELMFFHLGGLHTQPVVIHEVVGGQVRRLPFDPADFHYGKTGLVPARWPDLGYAGFRVHYALNTPAYKDELAAFLGASYFRVVGAGQRYGLSARGLAIDTTGSARGEEFPRFKAFWVERPAPDARSLTLHALLDSPRATGAYTFTIVPGRHSEVRVRSRVFLREPVAMLGIAPLTSMFVHGENGGPHGDFRPEVHDSDGLMVALGDAGSTEWLWRPLLNPKRPLATSFQARELRGFGLMQRDRAFTSYEDLEARYERRPSAWVVPEGHWGPGRVELLQLPTPDEGRDNIVAAWVPEKLPAPGEALDLAYRIVWQGDEPEHPPSAWAVQSRAGHGMTPLRPGEFQYVIDFAGPALDALPDEAEVEPVVTVGTNARLLERNVYRNDARGGWRMTVRVQRLHPAQPVELRAFLRLLLQEPRALESTPGRPKLTQPLGERERRKTFPGGALTETWTHVIPAD